VVRRFRPFRPIANSHKYGPFWPKILADLFRELDFV